jgi:hypothetical protein
MAIKFAVIMANRMDKLALPVNLRDISFLSSVDLYAEPSVLVDLHGVTQPFHQN